MGTPQAGVKQKQCRDRQVVSDIDALESESEVKTRKKKRAERKPSHTVKSLMQECFSYV